jgi:hypothetical protein
MWRGRFCVQFLAQCGFTLEGFECGWVCMHTHREAWSDAAGNTFCGATYTSVGTASDLERSIYFPMYISIFIFVLRPLVYKKLILAIMSLRLLVDLVVVTSKGRRWLKYMAVECILDQYNRVCPCSVARSIHLGLHSYNKTNKMY